MEVYLQEYFHTMELDKTMEIKFFNLFLEYFQNISIVWKRSIFVQLKASLMLQHGASPPGFFWVFNAKFLIWCHGNEASSAPIRLKPIALTFCTVRYCWEEVRFTSWQMFNIHTWPGILVSDAKCLVPGPGGPECKLFTLENGMPFPD